jgi:CheY-like chemotaxis protein
VLIVEDDPDVREMLDSLLQYEGYTTDTAWNGAEALKQVERRRPCLVLLDLMMPVMDGWEFRECQLQDPAIADVPVICVTAMHEPEKASEALGVPCLQKPIEIDTILDIVESTCGRGHRGGN